MCNCATTLFAAKDIQSNWVMGARLCQFYRFSFFHYYSIGAHMCTLVRKTYRFFNLVLHRFRAFFQLQDHLKEHLKTPIYSILKSNLITFFKTILALDDFDEQTILRTSSILDTNSYELRFGDGRGKIRAVYPIAAMMSHDCVPNTYHVFDDSMEIIARASGE